jgi:hypothetical protein
MATISNAFIQMNIKITKSFACNHIENFQNKVLEVDVAIEPILIATVINFCIVYMRLDLACCCCTFGCG